MIRMRDAASQIDSS